MKIENLTDEQNHQMAALATEYETISLSGDCSYKISEIRKGIDFIYKMSDLKSPEIVICPSPRDMAIESKIKKGDYFDYLGCGYDSGWTAFYDFMQQIGVKFDKDWGFNKWKNFIKKSGVFATVLCENVAFVCVRPSLVKRNNEGDLHCVDGPAIAWPDGYQEYALNGVWMEEEVVLTPAEKLNPHSVLKEKNAEVRREIIRKIGVERYVTKVGAKVIDKQGDYELIAIDLKDGRYRPYLKMRNPSIKTWHVEGVHPDIKTVEEAINWRRGEKKKWKPEVLT